MADITNTQAVAFAAQARDFALAAEKLYWKAKSLHLQWLNRGMDKLITNTADKVVDGRLDRPLDGIALTAQVTAAIALISLFEGGHLSNVMKASDLGKDIA